jgi:hypothetical protein
MLKRFVAECEEQPDAAWLARFNAGRGEAERWYRGEGRAAQASLWQATGSKVVSILFLYLKCEHDR